MRRETGQHTEPLVAHVNQWLVLFFSHSFSGYIPPTATALADLLEQRAAIGYVFFPYDFYEYEQPALFNTMGGDCWNTGLKQQ